MKGKTEKFKIEKFSTIEYITLITLSLSLATLCRNGVLFPSSFVSSYRRCRRCDVVIFSLLLQIHPRMNDEKKFSLHNLSPHLLPLLNLALQSGDEVMQW